MKSKDRALKSDPKTLARKDDCWTSKDAAQAYVASGKDVDDKSRVLSALEAFPRSTARGLHEKSGLDLHTCHARLPELRKKGLAVVDGYCRDSTTGRWAMLWRLPAEDDGAITDFQGDNAGEDQLELELSKIEDL